LDGARYTLKRHYEIPSHPVDTGAAFRATTPALFEQLAIWYSNSAAALEAIVSATPGASPIRCWPHHFDIATLIEVAPGKAINLGMDPGDDYWREPYFYASMSPTPDAAAPRAELAGNGLWHTRDWIGAVLPASRIDSANQQAQVDAFIRSAMSACQGLLLGS
jgi:hypothetical protein